MRKENFLTKYTVQVFYEDTDAGGIVYHANYLKFAERARGDFLKQNGLSNQILLKQGMGFVVKSVSIQYKAPAVLEDILTLETTLQKMTAASVLFNQKVTKQVDGQTKELVNMDICVVLIDAKTMLPKKIPPFLKEQITVK
ncbi:MAG: YbgC/FadM family acyl-CoA thioesterase [Alphaproteobacteria bacterium]|nr:YbgC/FadM family acyl-CoA thioesterase [Alphaproteobacteria bacterium]